MIPTGKYRSARRKTCTIIFFHDPTALVGLDLPSLRFRDHTQTHQTRYNCSGRVIGSKKRLIPDNIQHSHGRDIHAPAGFEHVISASERPQAHALDRATNEIGTHSYFFSHKSHINSINYSTRKPINAALLIAPSYVADNYILYLEAILRC